MLAARALLRLHGCSGPEVIKLFPCSTQLSTKFFLLINVKMPTFDGILTFISMINHMRAYKQEILNFFGVTAFMII